MLERHDPSDPDADSVREVIVLDLRHRLKNVYAMVGGVLALSARAQPEMQPFVEELRDRIAALEAAHAYLADGPAATEAERTVLGLLRVLVAPFNSVGGETIAVAGRDAALTERRGVILALIVRELATNSVKHGALSTEGGRVVIACSKDRGRYAIHWREAGGPQIARPPKADGSGLRLVDRAAALAGFAITREWRAHGLEAVIVIPIERLAR